MATQRAKPVQGQNRPAPPRQPAPPHQVWLMVGADDFQLDTLARRQIDELLPPAEQAFGLETFDAAAETVAAAAVILRRIIAALRTPTMFAARRLIWVRNASFLDDTIISRGKDIVPLARELAGLVAGGLPPEQFLIITAASVPAKSPLADACARHGALVKEEAAKPWQRQAQSAAYAARALKQAGLQADAAAVEKLVTRVGPDTRQMHQEIAKLAIYLGDRKQVTPEDIAEIVSASRDYFVWDLEDAVATGDLRQALEILRRLLFQREDPIRLVNTLESRFRYLLILQEAVREGWLRPGAGKAFGNPALPPELAAVFAGDRRMANPYTRNILAQQAAKFNPAALLRARGQIMAARLKLVSSSAPPEMIMEQLILRLCRRPRRAAAARPDRSPAGRRP